MKHTTKTSIFALTAAFLSLSAPAFAADVYRDRTPADAYQQHDASAPASTRSGFYLKGDLGIGNGDRDIRKNVNRNVDVDISDPAFTALLDGADGTAPDGVVSDTERAAGAAFLDSLNIPYTIGDSNATIPLVGDKFFFGDSGDFDAMVFGAEVSYLYQVPRTRFGVEFGLGITGYNDSETVHAYAGENGVFTGGTALADFSAGPGFDCTLINTCAGDASIPQSGLVAFERDFDIDLVARAHYFATDRLAFNIGGGPSWARGNIKSVSLDDTGFVTGLNSSIDENTWSLGYVLTVGGTYWVTDNITIGAAYDYKRHDFDASGSASDSANLGSGVSLNGRASERVDVEDEVHTFKARIGIKLN